MTAGLCRKVGVAVILVSAGGCSFGPRALQTNRVKYNEVLRQTWSEEFLLNLVRLRYRDPPQFDAVTNILSSHAFEAGVNEREELRSFASPAVRSSPQNLYNLHLFGGTAGVAERPTFSISPLEGAEFFHQLLGHIPVESIVLLANTGWDIDRVLRLTVQEMNGLENVRQVHGVQDHPPRYEEFTAVARRLGRLQRAGGLEVAHADFDEPLSEPVADLKVGAADLINAAGRNYRFHQVGPDRVALRGRERHPVMRFAARSWGEPAGPADVAEVLNLIPGQPAYKLVQGAGQGQFAPDPGPRAELTVSTRSPLGMMLLASKGVEVPARDVEQGLVEVPVDECGRPFDWTCVTGDLIRIHSQPKKPHRAFVCVKYRGSYFYIDDDDLVSKTTFALIIQVFGLQRAAGVTPGPVVTVPVGGGLQAGSNAPAGGGRGGGNGP
jgi:hypothetical protein